ncbi:MAG: RagB/SusD family nutrient uptake outer membrane protein [Cyclobacteriaceae bacterium]|nr:RagB/SusD family nutrient uptake outer membrane protein [Cyclobacteriaceae bacterium HetDA_MAG_MS6]
MKVLYIYLILAVTLFSCGDDFLERAPTDQVPTVSVFTTTDNVRAALNGIHRLMFSRVDPPDRQDSGGHGSIMITMGMLGEDLVMSSTGNGWYNSHYRWQNHRTVNFSLPAFSYRFYYRIIANANLIILNVDDADGPESDKVELKGQALCYRAFAHFMLVQLFAERYDAAGNNTQLGVPIVLEPTQEGLPRSTVEEVYTRINTDLDEAMTLLDGAPTREEKSHFNLGVAQGLKARVALTQGRWQTAADFAILARADYTLMSNDEYEDGFNDVSNPEWLWGSLQISDQQTFFASFFAFVSHNFSSTNIRTNPKAINSVLYDQMPDTDIRKANFALTGLEVSELPTSGSLSVPYQSRKFTAEGPSSSVGDVPYMRAAEMYLIEAEAKARLGQADATNILFELNSNRDASYVLSANTGQALIDEILLYRRMELWGEGFRFLDLKRLNIALDRSEGVSNHDAALTAGVFTVPVGDIRWQFVFPEDEINANDELQQNPL